MDTKGNPVRYKTVEKNCQVRRNVFCINYEDCLDYAIMKRWPGFSCERCDQYEAEDQVRQDMIGNLVNPFDSIFD
ncbi:MAG: hypothetical protein WCV59_03580 [Parcubacteria group bacterium]|jgi:hypothetical protein